MRRTILAASILAAAVSSAAARGQPDPPPPAAIASAEWAARHLPRRFTAETDDALPAYVLNRWGGVVRCERASTLREHLFCTGVEIPAVDPRRFDCRAAEVVDEFEFCGLPFPRRR